MCEILAGIIRTLRKRCEKFWPYRRTQIKARLLPNFPHSAVTKVSLSSSETRTAEPSSVPAVRDYRTFLYVGIINSGL